MAGNLKPIMAGSRAIRVAWMYQDSPFGAELYRGFAERVKDATLPIEAVAAERFRVGETDYRSLLTKIKGLGPDVLVPPGFRGETVAALQQAVVDVGFDLQKTHLRPAGPWPHDPLYY